MKKPIRITWFALFALLTANSANTQAEFTNDTPVRLQSVGLRGSLDSNTISHFEADSFELDTRFSLPWSWRSRSGWTLLSGLMTSLGGLRADSASALIAAVGPTLTLRLPRYPVTIDGGISPTFISRDQFNDFDLGGQFHFTSHIGISYGFDLGPPQSGSVSIGYRFQHISNAGFDSINPGLDFHMLELRYWLH